jgi:hypothetical protein
MTQSSLGHFLAADSFACWCGDQLVILCLSNDEYLTFSPAMSAGIAEAIADPSISPLPDIRDSLIALKARGVLVSDCRKGKLLEIVPSTKQNLRELPDLSFDEQTSINFIDLIRLVWAYCIARFLLALGIRYAVASVQNVRANSINWNDYNQLALIVTKFKRVQPFVMKQSENCLLRALTLQKFLVMYKIGVNWNFGIQLEPFRAHCWLQREDMLIDESIEGISALSIIMKS